MKRTALLLAVVGVLTACAESPSPVEEGTPPAGGPTAFCPTLVRAHSNPQNVSASSSGNGVSWFIQNNTGGSVTLTGETHSKDGTIVTSTTSTGWVGFPYVLTNGNQIDADILYDVAGPANGGSVGMTVSSSCGPLVLPAYTVNAN